MGKLEISISHERIYQHFWTDRHNGGTCCISIFGIETRSLKSNVAQRISAGQIKNRISIDEHPEIVAQKTRIDDWKIDIVIGKNHQDT